ncbi:hypothetical protein [Haloglomus litoreum]|uniref:hypothetical protein n=1 Tax=Haloglomus litoreum TaxID=3034026 RepID=UPI0023E8C6FF|nr:hypothetical protein [Haloglomus sp. DT116]
MSPHTVSVGIPLAGTVLGMAIMILGVLQGGINATLLVGTLVMMGGIGYLARDLIILEEETEPETPH